MASSMPKFPALPETKEEIDAFFKKVDENDAKEVKLELYFTQAEVDQMCDFEKKRLSNLKRNYDMMKQLGLPVDKPLFMQKNKKKQDEYSSSSDSDQEWTPALERPKPKSRGPVKSFWVTPTKKPPKKEKVETVTVPQEEAVDESELDFDGFGTDEKCSSVDDIKTIKPDRRKLASNIKKDKIDMEEMVLDYPADFDQFDVEAAEQKKGQKAKKVFPAVDPNRYPKRSIPVTNYADIEVPDDDHFLFCDDCHDEYLGDCPVHGPLKIVEDSKAEEGSPDHAEKSSPPGLVVKESQIPDAGSGVWSIEPMEKGVRLGPYKGETVKSEDKAHVSGYSWQVYGQNDKNHHFIDAGDTSTSNWMRFVNCARNEEEQNVLAYQYKGQIYYRTIKPVEKDMEMLVWYGDEYGRELGIKVASPQHVHRLLSFLHASTRNPSSDSSFWKLHGRRIEVPESEWKPLIHHDKGFPCDVCGVAFVKEEYMLQHRKNKHQELYRTGQKKHQCEQCSYSTDITTNLAHHMLTHTGEKPFTCQDCGKGFTTTGNLKQHKRIHSGEQPYQCTVCEKRFNQSSALSLHMHTHNTKLFQCTVCDKSFTRNFVLKTHMKIHTGVLDFACSYCDFKTNTASALKKHVIAQHTHDYPHHCPVCDKGFVAPSDMRKHIAHNHKS